MDPTITLPTIRVMRLLAATTALLFVAGGAVATSGRPTAPLVRAIAVGHAPQAVVLDPHGDRAFVLGADATVWLVDLAHARVLRTLVGDGAPSGLSPTLALDTRTQRLFVVDPRDGLGPGVVRMLDSRSGALRATVRVGSGAIALAVDERRGQVFVANSRDGSISVLDARTAHLQRTVRLAAAPVALAVDGRTARAFVVADGVGAGHESDAVVSMLDTRTGSLVQIGPSGAGPMSVVVDVRRARAFVMNGGDGTVSMLDAHDGTLLRTVWIGGPLSALAVDERRGRVYVADASAGTLSLLDAASGTLLRTLQVDPSASPTFTLPDALAVDEARDRVYLSTWGPLEPVAGASALRGQGTLYVLDARTGAVLRTIATGVAPQAIAVAERSGRIVVVNGGGAVRVTEGWAARWGQQVTRWLPWLGRIAPRAPGVALAPSNVSVIEAAP